MKSPDLPRRSFLALAGTVGLPTSFAREVVSDEARIATTVDRAFAPLLPAHDIPGMAVAVTAGGRDGVYCWGTTAREGGVPVTQDTLFELGSISKAFTATLACRAQALGKLSLADTAGTHLQALRGTAIDRASLLHLGTYTAGGLPLQFPQGIASLDEAVAYLRQWAPSHAPGTLRRYSNPSIGLLGHVSALAMGGTFADLAHSELFAPLGLRDTAIRVPAADMVRYAWGHDRANRLVRVNPGVFDGEAYGVKSTAADMLRFVQAQLDPGRLPQPLRAAVTGTQNPHFEVDGLVQGLGWEQHPWPVLPERLLAGNASAMALEPRVARPWNRSAPSRDTLFNKTGSTNGFGGYVAFVPSRRTGIVMLANRNIPNEARVAAAHAVLAMLAPG